MRSTKRKDNKPLTAMARKISFDLNGSSDSMLNSKMDIDLKKANKRFETIVALRSSLDSLASMPGSSLNFYKSRLNSKRTTRRLVHKDGVCNVSHVNVPKQRRKYIIDIFTTLIDVKWRWSLLIFAAAFLLSWTLFAVIYYLILLAHGDFTRSFEEYSNHPPCIHNIRNYSFTSVFLFSVETQHTIGYGYRYISEKCPEAVFTLCLQSIIGVMIQSFMAGIVFAKIARPKKRAETLIYSREAVINMRDNKLCFMFRVGDMRKSHLVEAHIRVQMIKKRITREGELLPFHQFDMNVGYDEGLDRIFLVWPLTICHVIDEESPLYEYSADDLATARFEIVVILEGIVESTGMTAQARTSYIPSEILWGRRFEKLVTYQRDNGEYRIDYERFHKSYEVETPTISAKDLYELQSNTTDDDMRRDDKRISAEDISSFDGVTMDSPIRRPRKASLSNQSNGSQKAPLVNQVLAKVKQKWSGGGNFNNQALKLPPGGPEILVQSPSGSSIGNGDICSGSGRSLDDDEERLTTVDDPYELREVVTA